MHVIVVGAGAVGTLYGGWLLAGGADVSFVARGSNLVALQTRGLEIHGREGSYQTAEVQASKHIQDFRPADVLVYTVKLFDLADAARATHSALRPGGLVVGLQNGVDAAEILASVSSKADISVGPVYNAARLVAPAVVEYSGARRVVLGGRVDPPLLALTLVEVWRRAGVDARLTGDIEGVLWGKMLGFATNAALTCLSRQSAGVVYTDPNLLEIARRSIREMLAVAAAAGVQLPSRAEDETIALLQSFPPDMVASMRQDLDAGRRLEVEGVFGTVQRLGRTHGVPTPFFDVAYACLKPFKDGTDKRQR